jgi:uncharacterized Zn-finger protein
MLVRLWCYSRRCFSESTPATTNKSSKIIELLNLPQAPNRATTWSKRQRPKFLAVAGPRFADVDISAQPNPKAAIEMIKETPIVMVDDRAAACDGDGLLGHPRVYINLVRKSKL